MRASAFPSAGWAEPQAAGPGPGGEGAGSQSVAPPFCLAVASLGTSVSPCNLATVQLPTAQGRRHCPRGLAGARLAPGGSAGLGRARGSPGELRTAGVPSGPDADCPQRP